MTLHHDTKVWRSLPGAAGDSAGQWQSLPKAARIVHMTLHWMMAESASGRCAVDSARQQRSMPEYNQRLASLCGTLPEYAGGWQSVVLSQSMSEAGGMWYHPGVSQRLADGMHWIHQTTNTVTNLGWVSTMRLK